MYEYAKNQLNSFLPIQFVTRVATTTSDHNQPNIFLSALDFQYQHVKK